ncbi:MAG: antA/AntB antirepressor family protein, partial [Nanoarchaeota archaeon]
MTNVVLSEIVSNHLTEEYPVNSEKLFLFLNNNSKYADWIQNRIKQYGFMENEDFTIQMLKTKGRPKKIYWITLDMAKELAMVENNEKGRQARKYFIEIEKKYKHKFYQPHLRDTPQILCLSIA